MRHVDRLALVEDDEAARPDFEERPVVGREEDGRARLVDLFEEAEEVDRELGVEVARRLVGEDERRLADDGAGDRDALLLAAREDAGGVFAAPLQADALERLADARATRRLGRPSTSRVMATFSKTVHRSTSLKSWKTTPMLRRRNGTELAVRRAMSRPMKRIRPWSTVSARWRRRRSVDLPAPLGPVMKTNSPRSIISVIPRRTGAPGRKDL